MVVRRFLPARRSLSNAQCELAALPQTGQMKGFGVGLHQSPTDPRPNLEQEI